ncbi:MAG: hypothetical protein FWG03_09360 [Clostridiales bacterium]|nr:hypothetical protein [Clostridiales bacterium]
MKSIRKTIVVVISAILAVALLGGCKGSGPASGDDESIERLDIVIGTEKEGPGPEQGQDPEPEQKATQASAMELPDDPYSFVCMLDGVVYQLPAPFSEFAANGWEIIYRLGVDYANEKLDPGTYTGVVVVENGEHQVYMDFLNDDMDTKVLTECSVGGIDLDYANSKYGASLVLPAGIKLGTPEEDVLAAYGEPTDFYDGVSSRMYKYDIDYYSKVQVDVDADTGLVYGLKIQNFIRHEKKEDAGGEAPDVVKAYKAPSEIGDSWDSYTLKFGGTLMKLPVPVSELMANGWVPVSDENIMIAAKDYAIGFEIRNGNQVLRTNLRNYADTQQPVKYCFITKIEYSDYSTKISIELPGGITEKSPIEDFIKAYGKPDEEEENTVLKYYKWGDYSEGLEVSINNESGEISRISLEYEPRSVG